MGNFKIGYNFVPFTPTASTSASGYPATNLSVYGHTKRHWRSTVTTETTIVFNYAAAKSIVGIVLSDVNFTACYIQACATDSWPGTYRLPAVSGNLTVSKDERTQRYNIFIPATFNLQYSRLVITSQTPTDGAAYFRIGTAVHLNTVLTLTANPFLPYEYSADEKTVTNEFESGGYEVVNLGDLIWEGAFSWTYLNATNEGEIWTINGLKKDANLIFYENISDTSKVYLCRRRSVIEVSELSVDVRRIPTVTLREVY